jgi:potassium-transporting ATPase KdpC subunit
VANLLRPAISLFVLLSAIVGVLYPLAMTGIAQALFPDQANGSLVVRHGTLVGSTLVGQQFSDPGHFWGRPSATALYPYNGVASGGSNLGPSNPALADAVKARVAALRAADPNNERPIPAELVLASASGLDPHIGPAAADYQVERVARARKLSPETVRALVARETEGREWGLFGEPRVNVLKLNLALDAMSPGADPPR